MIYLDGKEKDFNLHTSNENLFLTREQVDELYRRHVLLKCQKISLLTMQYKIKRICIRILEIKATLLRGNKCDELYRRHDLLKG